MPIYEFEHPKTGEIFEEIRSFKDIDKPFIAPDGTKCRRLRVPSKFTGWRVDREVFELDPDYAKKLKPKYVKFRDGHKEKYDPTKHC
jgi:hypothetical protein